MKGTHWAAWPRSMQWLCAALLLSAGSGWSADDPYLQALDAEVDKVESHPVDVAHLSAADAAAAAASREAFELLLRDRYAGTFVFYNKLPERSRQEIFDEYAGGASITGVRKKIIDRLLQR